MVRSPPGDGAGRDDYDSRYLVLPIPLHAETHLMADFVLSTDTTAYLFFFLVDATDGITPETGVTGTPQVSRNGGAWTSTGVAALTEVGNGHYYSTVNLTTLGVSAGDLIVGRFKSAATAEAPSLNSLMVVPWDPALDWQGSTFDASTDSLEALRDRFDAVITPSLSTSSSLSGSGFLNDAVAQVRRWVDEPSADVKYNDSDIIVFLEAAYRTILTDLANVTDHPLQVRHNVSVAVDVQSYTLPPTVGELLQVAKMNSETGQPEYEIVPTTLNSAHGQGYWLEGNNLRLASKWKETETLRLTYIPTFGPSIHLATASSATASTIVFPSSVTDGTLDLRPNAYVGYMVKIVSATAGAGQERIISAYDESTRTATLETDWDTTPTGTIVYEVVPLTSDFLKDVVVLQAARDICAADGNGKKREVLKGPFMERQRAMRMALSRRNSRFPGHFIGDTVDNVNRGMWGSDLGGGLL